MNSQIRHRTLILLLSFSILACNTDQELTETQKLYLTAKLWGFLKYYHPEVNKGQINWDDELINFIPRLADAKTNQDLSKLYVRWIDSLGDVSPCLDCDTPTAKDYFDKNFNLSWLQAEAFSPELMKRLQYIQRNRTQRQHYVSLEGANTYFTNESVIPAAEWKDKHVRLLTLFRYWNVIEYFYPYKYVMDNDWDDLLLYFIPKFSNVHTEQEYHLLIRELTVSLCDSHSFFTTDLIKEFAGRKYIAATFVILDDKAVINGFYNDSLPKLDDLRLGDAILSVDNIPVAEIYNKNVKYINGSNDAVKKLDYSFRWILNGNTDTVKITFERMGEIQSKVIRRYEPSMWKTKQDAVIGWKVLAHNIGYVNLEEGIVKVEDLSRMMQELASTKAIIFDLRGYPEFMWDELLAYFNKEEKVFSKLTEPDLSYPGRFVWQMGDTIGKFNPSAYSGKVMILMHEGTQSRAESFVMALQTIEGAITIGRQTSGADGNIAEFVFFNDKISWITGRGVFYPDGRETQRIGIVPDVHVPLTLEDIRTSRDAILEKAIAMANQMK